MDMDTQINEIHGQLCANVFTADGHPARTVNGTKYSSDSQNKDFIECFLL